jgi:hypothetical protein
MLPKPIWRLEFGWFANLSGLLKIIGHTQQFGFLPRPGHNLKPDWESCLTIAGGNRDRRIAHNAYGITISDESEEGINFFT